MKKRLIGIPTAGVFLGAWLLALAPTTWAAREVSNFNLLDLQGRDHELYRAEGRAVVLFFTGTGCPVARKSSPKLREIEDRFGKQGVSVWVVNSYPDDTLDACSKEADELELRYLPYLRDRKQAVAVALGVRRTAEVVAIGTTDWKVFYQGAIDDQLTEGAEKPAPLKRFLVTALEEFLAGKNVVLARTPAHGCRLAYANIPESEVGPDYTADVAPILRRHCVECHREGAIGPWAMDRYERVRNRHRMIEEVLLTRRMPPWDPDPDFGRFENAHSLTVQETQTLLRWIEAGAPRGKGPDPLMEPLPLLPVWPEGKPDVVIRLSQPEQIPATGVLEYRHIPVSSPFTNDVWISGTDVKPGNRRVVHHAILYARWPGCPDDGTGNGVFFCGWAPGTPPNRLPKGVARKLPAGAELTLEMHYTTCGSEQSDQTEVALYLAPGPQPRESTIRAAVEPNVNVPPKTDESRHVSTYAFTRPATLYSLSPHMHVRGSWMRYELLLPDGRRETLLHVPSYDFKWQFNYRLAEPLAVPAGAWLMVTGAFDNSPAKSGNPNPERRIHFGKQSWDEMFIGFFEAADEPAGGGSATGAGSP